MEIVVVWGVASLDDVVVYKVSVEIWQDLLDEVADELLLFPPVVVLSVSKEVWGVWEIGITVLEDLVEWVLDYISNISSVAVVVEDIGISISGDVESELVSNWVWSGPLDSLHVWGNVDWLNLHIHNVLVVVEVLKGDTLSSIWVGMDTVLLNMSVSGATLWVHGSAVVESTETEVSLSEVIEVEVAWGVGVFVDNPALTGLDTLSPPVVGTSKSVTEEGSEDEKLVHLFEIVF